MRHLIFIKIIVYAVIFFSLLNGWWFVALPLLLFGAWQLNFSIELLIAGVMYDALFGMIKGTGMWGYSGTILAVFILIIVRILKKVMR